MPYPESCPECGGAFRNTGTHFTARRNEIGRHVLLQLGCQNTTRRFWWDFTTASLTEDGRPSPIRRAVSAASVAPASNGLHHRQAIGEMGELNGHTIVSVLDAPDAVVESDPAADSLSSESVAPPEPTPAGDPPSPDSAAPPEATIAVDLPSSTSVATREAAAAADSLSAPGTAGGLSPLARESHVVEDELVAPPTAQRDTLITEAMELAGPFPTVTASLKDAFVRQLQLDRLTLRQMRSWLMSEEARRAIEVAAGATEATYERLALILFGADLPRLLGTEAAAPSSPGMSAEERLELQREKARIRARLRRAAAKAARQPG